MWTTIIISGVLLIVLGVLVIRAKRQMSQLKNGKEIHRFVGVKTKDYLMKELDRRTAY